MIFQCKNCGAEYELREINFEGKTFCKCGSMELIFLKGGVGQHKKKF